MTREEAISLIKSAQLMLINPTTNEPVSDLYMALYMAISALEQEPSRKGHWIEHEHLYKCSVCGEISCCHGKFCNECGAEMEESEDEE